MKKKVHIEGLDGLRFICFLMVFLFHSFYTEFIHIKQDPLYRSVKFGLFGNGNLGVNFFFVLSGFLITYLLIEEKLNRPNIAVGWFYVRRVLRIWPVYYLSVVIGFLGFPLLKKALGMGFTEIARPVFYLFFISNFDIIRNGMPDASVLGVLWSVAIEEQFYLFWPLLLWLLPVGLYRYAFVSVVFGSLVFRSFYDSPVMHEHHTLSCIGDMAIGAIGAWMMLCSASFRESIIGLSRWWILFLYVGFIVIFFYREELFYHNYFLRIVERSLIAVLMLGIILEQGFARHSLFKLDRIPLIGRLGVVSYGMYCYHFIGILIAINLTRLLHWNTALWQVLVLETTLALLMTIAISMMSYRYLELPFLRLKDRFSVISR